MTLLTGLSGSAHTVHMTSTKTRRICPGSYEIDTSLGTFGVDRIMNEYGDTTYTEWFVVWPGQRSPDAVFATLRDAKAMIAAEVAS